MKFVNGLSLEVTQRCNSNCLYCFSNSSPETLDEIPVDKLIEIIEEYEALENKVAYDRYDGKKLESQIVITGGEFLLHKQWRAFFSYLTKRKIPFIAATNGIQLNPEIVDFLSSTSIKLLQISLDGVKEQDNRLRNPLSTNKVIDNIKYISNTKFKKKVVIKSTLTQYNIDSMDELILFCKKLGLQLNFGFVQILGRAMEYKNIALSSKQIHSVNVKITEKFPEIPLPVMFSHSECPLDIDKEPMSFRVAANGDIYPCASFHEKFFSIGNVYQNTLLEAVESRRFSEIQKWISARKKIMLQENCKGCYVANICKGSCPAASHYEMGDVYKPNTRLCEACQSLSYYMLPRMVNRTVPNVERV